MESTLAIALIYLALLLIALNIAYKFMAFFRKLFKRKSVPERRQMLLKRTMKINRLYALIFLIAGYMLL